MTGRRRAYRILITGSRNWTARPVIAQAISDWLRTQGTTLGGAYPFPVVIHGGAAGADALAGQIADNWGWSPEVHKADWSKYGRSAGHRRNARMVSLGADVCLAFPLGASPGTRGCMAIAERAGIPVINHGDPA